MQTLSLRVEAGRVMASGSRASSAVMRFQHGRPIGDVSGRTLPMRAGSRDPAP